MESGICLVLDICICKSGDHFHELRTRHICGRRKCGCGHAIDNAKLIEMIDVIIGPTIRRYVREREFLIDVDVRRRRDAIVGAVNILHDVQIEQPRFDNTVVKNAANKLKVVAVLNGHDIPDARLVICMCITVTVRIALLIVLGQTL